MDLLHCSFLLCLNYLLCYKIQPICECCRLGFLIDFLSHAAIVGFMDGAAITISLQQLKGLLGIQNFTKKTDIVSVMRSVWTNVHHGVNLYFVLKFFFRIDDEVKKLAHKHLL